MAVMVERIDLPVESRRVIAIGREVELDAVRIDIVLPRDNIVRRILRAAQQHDLIAHGARHDGPDDAHAPRVERDLRRSCRLAAAQWHLRRTAAGRRLVIRQQAVRRLTVPRLAIHRLVRHRLIVVCLAAVCLAIRRLASHRLTGRSDCRRSSLRLRRRGRQ